MCVPAALHATSPTSKNPYNHSAGDEIFHCTYLYRDNSSELLHCTTATASVPGLLLHFCKTPTRGGLQQTFTSRALLLLVLVTKVAQLKQSEDSLRDWSLKVQDMPFSHRFCQSDAMGSVTSVSYRIIFSSKSTQTLPHTSTSDIYNTQRGISIFPSTQIFLSVSENSCSSERDNFSSPVCIYPMGCSTPAYQLHIVWMLSWRCYCCPCVHRAYFSPAHSRSTAFPRWEN